MGRLEREVLNIEAREADKAVKTGLPLPSDQNNSKTYSYSSLQKDVSEEFKNA